MRRRPTTARRFGRHMALVTASVVLLAVMAGCATPPATSAEPDSATTAVAPQSTQEIGKAPIQEGWWRVRFRMDWPEDEDPAWPMDLLVAHRIVAPVLRQYRDDIELWRFHRRAGRDGAGHQFSLIFYSSPQIAEGIYARFQADPLLQQLQRQQLIKAVSYTSTAANEEPNIESTSDPNWSAVIQKSWPYFIMGVSEMWLDMVDRVASETPPPEGPSLEELKDYYAQVNAGVGALWRNEGQHAFLHHLSGVFGYEQLLIRETRAVQY